MLLEQPPSTPAADTAPGGGMMIKVALAIGGLFILILLWMMYDLSSRVSKIESSQKAQAEEIAKRLDAAEGRSKANAQALADRIGMTQKELQSKADDLERSQHASEVRLARAQDEKLKSVAGEVAGVKTDVGGVKTDLGNTKSDLEATKAKLEKTIGDLGVQSGLIARTHDELEVLKHKGDRNYYEFSLKKGNSPVAVGTVSLQLKKTDSKKNKFNMIVFSDDKQIEKRDKTIFEPLQFYTGRDRMLYEVVVNALDKNTVSGYLATPKTAPVPVTP